MLSDSDEQNDGDCDNQQTTAASGLFCSVCSRRINLYFVENIE